MNRLLIILLGVALLSCSTLKNEEKKTVAKTFHFPFEWIGHYEGELKIYKKNKLATTIKMSLIIDTPDAEGYYPWTLIYNEEDIRKYGLEAINSEVGHYRINEFNSIKIDGYYNGGHFTSRFEVLGNDLLVDYFRVEQGIEISFYISSSNPSSVTGDEIIGNDTIPPVKSFPFVVFQKALLSKVIN